MFIGLFLGICWCVGLVAVLCCHAMKISECLGSMPKRSVDAQLQPRLDDCLSGFRLLREAFAHMVFGHGCRPQWICMDSILRAMIQVSMSEASQPELFGPSLIGAGSEPWLTSL
jgi:hypothetical protein